MVGGSPRSWMVFGQSGATESSALGVITPLSLGIEVGKLHQGGGIVLGEVGWWVVPG